MTSEKLDVFLHAGAHKTATTHLQNILFENTKVIAESGVAYLGPAQIREGGGNIYQALGVQKNRSGVLTSLSELASGRSRVVVSEENIVGRCTSQAGMLRAGGFYPKSKGKVDKLMGGLADHNVHLCFAVREPTQFVTSLYSQVLLANMFVSWKGFLTDNQPWTWKWSDMLLPHIEAHPWATVTLWRYEDYHDVFPQISATLLGSDHPKLAIDLKKRKHTGLSKAAIVACRKWHAEGYTGPIGHIAREDFPISKENRPFSPWNKKNVKESQATYDADIALLEQHPRITVLRAPDAKG